jgi:predicted ArsR family transcriptional regulator
MTRAIRGLQAIISALETVGPMSRWELTEYTGRSATGVVEPLQVLRGRNIVHIAKYRRQNGVQGRSIPLYALGNKPDAIEPPRETRAKVMARYNKKHSATIALRKRLQKAAAEGVVATPWMGL